MSLNKNLPHEIVLEILKRLPVKPLMRFKCVSKSWQCMIEDPDFMAIHLKHSALSDTNWYVLFMDWCFSHDQTISMYLDKSLTAHSRSQIEVPFISPKGNYRVVGSCNGLICVSEANIENGSQTIFLWNLFNRKYKAVQISPPKFVHTRMVLGFGYSDRINDYKVVRITYFRKKYGRCLGGLECEADVYSLGTDLWRTVEFDIRCKLSELSAVSFNGNLHWISMHVDEDRCWHYGSIITFGVVDEVFNEMALPKSYCVRDRHDRVHVAVLKGSLVLLLTNYWNNKCYVWVMTEYGVPESWIKMHTLDLNGGMWRYHGFTRSGELVMETYKNELISWNPSVGQTQLLGTSGAFDLVSVVESLVSP